MDYVSHVLMHHKRLYRYHKQHHLKIVPTYADTYVGHILEGPIQSLGACIPFLWWNYSVYEILIILAFLNIRGMMRHDSRFIFLIGNHHLLHHKYPNYNFGEYWIDSICGTKYPGTREYTPGLIYL